jgi:tetratricopeptide (TPR) repeat protein
MVMSRMRKCVFAGSFLAAGALAALLISTAWPTHAISAAGRGESNQSATGLRAANGGMPAADPASLQTARNLGKAYYEQGKYAEAAAQFRKVVASGRALSTDHLNLGLALMQANKLDEALGELTTAKQMDPQSVAIQYNLGILYKHELRYPDAATELKRVTEAEPSEPSGWFNLGTIYFAERKFPEALEAYEHVNKMGLGRGQNFYVASLFRTFTVLLRLGRQAEAQKILKIHQRVHDKVPSISLQNQALEGGKFGAILVPAAPTTLAEAPEQTVTFADITAKLGVSLKGDSVRLESAREISAGKYSLEFARKNLVPLLGSSAAVGDYDGDGHPDVYIVNPAGGNHLLHNNGDGTFTDVTEKAGVAGPAGSVSATFADYDNSGRASLFVTGLGGVTLYKNKGDGTFENVTDKAGLKGKAGELDTSAVLFDSDSDGFLDLVVTAYTDLTAPPKKASFSFPADFSGAQSRFYRNNGNGTFTDATASSGLSAARGRMRGAVFGAFTDSGYDDLVFFRDDAPPLLFVNEGEDKFVNRTREAGASFGHATATAVQVADFNHDGNFDLVLWSASGPEVLFGQGNGRFSAAERLPAVTPPSRPFAFEGTVADLDGDGFEDLLAQDADGKWRFLSNHAGHFQEGSIHLPADFLKGEDAAQILPAWLSNSGKPDLIALSTGGRLAAVEKEGPPAHWVAVNLKGYKSNKAGIGTVVELKSGNYYSKFLVTGSLDGAYTGDLTKLDVVRVTWPNQVIQNSINVQTDRSVLVQESERLASSCPLLYVWNGKRFVFVTDVLGVSPLGELAPDGTYVKPNPREFVRLPGALRPRDGAYTFQLTDELREVDFVDRLRLMTVDHPSGEHVYADEIYSSSPAAPQLFAVQNERPPLSAVDGSGRDVLNLLRKVDGRYVTGFSQGRIPGMAETHTLTLDLGSFSASRRAALWLTGWVYWTDSNGARALMADPQLSMIFPYLQVKDASGKWVTVIPDMGVPSGTNRTMRVDLKGKFLSADHHVRIVTNLCIYWDRAFLSLDDRRAEPTQVLAPLSADLHYRGFSVPASDPNHRRPDYFEYTSLLKQAPWNPMTGNYTRYGNVRELLSGADDRLVVMATGDEMTVDFSAQGLKPLRPGWKRDFFLDASGYAKDGEPNTAYSKTVAPLPFQAMRNYPPATNDQPPTSHEYRQYVREFLTRPGHKLVPPLAPAVH